MNRTLSLLACAALAAAPAAAQCFTATGTSIAAQMVPTSFWAAHDEGVSPDQALGFPFPLGGVNWTHLVVSSNGAVYLTDGTGAIGVPDFGMPSLAALRGAAGDSPRICPFAADLEAIPNSSTWDILVDTSVSGEIKVTWVGVQHYFAPTAEDFSFSVKLTAAGVVEFSYEGTNYGTPGVFDWVAVSAGNGVGTGTEPVSDLSGNADSGAVEVIYENGWPNGFDLNGLSISIVSNGTGGLLSFRSCGIARHEAVGDGCHDLARESFYQWFTDAGVASTTLSGNGIALSRTADGYTASWIPGVASALYVPPSSGATLLAVLNDDEVTFTPAAGFPIPGGTVSELTVQGNGIVAFGAGPTEPLVDNWIPTPQGMLDGSHGGVYFWHPYNEEEGGDVFAEEVGGVIYVTFQDVENFPLGTVNPSTWQLQIDQATGDMFMLFVSIDSDNSPIFGQFPQDHLIGFTPPGASLDPGPVDLVTGLPLTTMPDVRALALTASPAPISTATTGATVDYTVDHALEITNGGGVVAGVVAFSLTSGNVDLTPVGAPGCFGYVGGLDLTVAFIGPVGGPQTVPLPLPPGLPSGTVIYAQAASLSVGVNALSLITSNGVASTVGPN